MAKETLGKKGATVFQTLNQPSIMDVSFDPDTLEPKGPSSIMDIVEKRSSLGIADSRRRNNSQSSSSSSSPPRRQSLLTTASSFYVLPEAGDSSSLASVSTAVAMLRHMNNEQQAKSHPPQRRSDSSAGENTGAMSMSDHHFASLSRPLTASSGSLCSNFDNSDDSDDDGSPVRSVVSSMQDPASRPYSTASATSESSLGIRSLRPLSGASILPSSRPHSQPAHINSHFNADPSMYVHST
jgi:hypothetical protein